MSKIFVVVCFISIFINILLWRIKNNFKRDLKDANDQIKQSKERERVAIERLKLQTAVNQMNDAQIEKGLENDFRD